jgi:hypothetical protein
VLDPSRRRLYAQLEPAYRVAIGAMVGASLAGHFVLSSRTFPFVDWSMYTNPISGDPVVVEYDAVLRSGKTIPLGFSSFLGTQSAGRLMEAMRRQVLRLQSLSDGTPEKDAARQEHELALRAIARWHGRRHAEDPAVSVLVSERTVSLRDGERSQPRRLWEVAVT